uniref:Uncharacterized protein n=1 Tax=Glossina brevipalpis TaxID=37001 RepID=A0A1A9WZ30_9MUSC
MTGFKITKSPCSFLPYIQAAARQTKEQREHESSLNKKLYYFLDIDGQVINEKSLTRIKIRSIYKVNPCLPYKTQVISVVVRVMRLKLKKFGGILVYSEEPYLSKVPLQHYDVLGYCLMVKGIAIFGFRNVFKTLKIRNICMCLSGLCDVMKPLPNSFPAVSNMRITGLAVPLMGTICSGSRVTAIGPP